MEKRIVLASASPRRKEILKNIGLQFEIIPSDAEEKISEGLEPCMIVQELSLAKGAEVAARTKNAIIISADTIVCYDGKILGKPSGVEEAKEMLKMLSGNSHEVYTGISVTDSKSGKAVSDYETTKVVFRKLTEEEIDRYVRTGESMDKAGAYGIQGVGGLLVESISGDYFNVVGLPARKLYEILKEEFNINIL